MKLQPNWKRIAQFIVVLLAAASLKLYYSTVSVNELRWILAPTTFCVEMFTGTSFEFESHAGYMKSDHTFLIAASCSGVNFLITAFLMLSLSRLWKGRSQNIRWGFIPAAALVSYIMTIVANTLRITTSLQTRQMNSEMIWLNPDKLHRFEGILIYFGFLLLLFIVSETINSDKASNSENASDLFRRSFSPLLIYYATTLGIPLVNAAYHQGIAVTVPSGFLEHLFFVLLTPLLLILPLAAFRFIKGRRVVLRVIQVRLLGSSGDNSGPDLPGARF